MSMRPLMRTIGLTGGIASGKSSLARLLAAHDGAVHIDADKLGHQAYIKDSPTYHKVIEHFGKDIVRENGEIDRRALGKRVFGDPNELKALTDVVWPAIAELAQQRIDQAREEHAGVAIVEAAVLIEAKWMDFVDEVWVVTVPPSIAIQRVMRRDRISEEEAKRRVGSQLSNEERSRHADVVIARKGDEPIEQLKDVSEELWASLSESV